MTKLTGRTAGDRFSGFIDEKGLAIPQMEIEAITIDTRLRRERQ